MDDTQIIDIPNNVLKIERLSKDINFDMASDYKTGSLLRFIVSTKNKVTILELGTGTGLSSAWMLAGMDDNSSLETVDNDQDIISVAKSVLEKDKRIQFFNYDGENFIKNAKKKYNIIFADAWPGKYSLFYDTLQLLVEGGIYIIDDMLPQPNWPEGHENNVTSLIQIIDSLKGYHVTKLNWATGIIMISRRSL